MSELPLWHTSHTIFNSHSLEVHHIADSSWYVATNLIFSQESLAIQSTRLETNR